MKNNIVTIAIGIISMLLVMVVVVVIAGEDKKGPVITISIPEGQQITYASGDDEKKLVTYAKAIDEKDGDVSDSIMIEGIYVMSDLQTAKVVYVARDKNNNITKLNQTVKYVPTKEELDNLAKMNQESASSSSTKAVAETKAQTSSTKAQDTTKSATAATALATTTADPIKPVLTLSQSEVTLTQGNSFYVNSYIKDITDDKDTRSTLFTRIIVSGGYDMNTPGDYTINVYSTDTEGNSSNSEKLIIHVQAKQEAIEAPASEPTPEPAPAPAPTPEPTPAPTPEPTPAPIPEPTQAPTQAPTPETAPAETVAPVTTP